MPHSGFLPHWKRPHRVLFIEAATAVPSAEVPEVVVDAEQVSAAQAAPPLAVVDSAGEGTVARADFWVLPSEPFSHEHLLLPL